MRCGYGVTDVTAGLFAVIGILLAPRARETTGCGQYVDVSMLDDVRAVVGQQQRAIRPGQGVRKIQHADPGQGRQVSKVPDSILLA